MILNGEKYVGTGLISEKKQVLYVKLNERVEASTSTYSATTNFLQYIYYALNNTIYYALMTLITVAEQLSYRKLLIAFMKSCAEPCALQLYRTSLKDTFC